MIGLVKNLLVTTFKTTRAAVVKRSSFNNFDVHKAANKLSPYLKKKNQKNYWKDFQVENMSKLLMI